MVAVQISMQSLAQLLGLPPRARIVVVRQSGRDDTAEFLVDHPRIPWVITVEPPTVEEPITVSYYNDPRGLVTIDWDAIMEVSRE
jgi:hypothetical protein